VTKTAGGAALYWKETGLPFCSNGRKMPRLNVAEQKQRRKIYTDISGRDGNLFLCFMVNSPPFLV